MVRPKRILVSTEKIGFFKISVRAQSKTLLIHSENFGTWPKISGSVRCFSTRVNCKDFFFFYCFLNYFFLNSVFVFLFGVSNKSFVFYDLGGWFFHGWNIYFTNFGKSLNLLEQIYFFLFWGFLFNFFFFFFKSKFMFQSFLFCFVGFEDFIEFVSSCLFFFLFFPFWFLFWFEEILYFLSFQNVVWLLSYFYSFFYWITIFVLLKINSFLDHL